MLTAGTRWLDPKLAKDQYPEHTEAQRAQNAK